MECDFVFGLEFGCFVKYVEQCFVFFFVEFLCDWQFFEDDYEIGLCVGFCNEVGQVVVQCVVVFFEMFWKQE